MNQEKIDRINELARKSRESKLSDAELEEQKQLRQEYIKSVKENFVKSIENITIIDADGKTRDIKKKK